MTLFRSLNAGTAAIAALLAAATLSGCTDARRALGYEKSPPDEFAVVARAPLSQPPDYNLRPPAPGAPRPQEGTASDQARAALTPGKTAAQIAADRSKGEQALLVKAGADKVGNGIRKQVNEETTALAEADNSFVEKLMFWRDAPLPGDALDPAGEAKRLKDNASLGKPPTAGETVQIKRSGSNWLNGILGEPIQD
jgi:hypothetical protein